MNRRLEEYIRCFETGRWDSRLSAMYGPSAQDAEKKRYLTLLEMAGAAFGNKQLLLLSACGRAELGGNHADHNHGNVIAAGIHLDILAAVVRTQDLKVTLLSDQFPEIHVDLRDLSMKEEEKETSEAIIRGVAAEFKAKGCEISGFKACLTSNIPVGSGLSSSAAFEVLISQIFNHLANKQRVSRMDIAKISGKAENLYFGKPCGLMDQIACAFNGILQIDFKTPDDPQISEIDFDFDAHDYQAAIVQTGGDHANLTHEYAAIPEEMSDACRCLGREWARGLTEEEIFQASGEIRKKAGDRSLLRLYHFVRENRRAVAQAQALERGDIGTFLRLANLSGDSSYKYLQNCYRSKDTGNQPIPLALAMSEFFLGETGAWRVHGGGFAGTILVFTPKNEYEPYRQFMESCFGAGSVIPLHIRQPGNEFFDI